MLKSPTVNGTLVTNKVSTNYNQSHEKTHSLPLPTTAPSLLAPQQSKGLPTLDN